MWNYGMHIMTKNYMDVIISAMACQITGVSKKCLLNRLFRRGSNKTSKLRVTGLFDGNHRWIPLIKDQWCGNVSIWSWMRHMITNSTSTRSPHKSWWRWHISCGLSGLPAMFINRYFICTISNKSFFCWYAYSQLVVNSKCYMEIE